MWVNIFCLISLDFSFVFSFISGDFHCGCIFHMCHFMVQTKQIVQITYAYIILVIFLIDFSHSIITIHLDNSSILLYKYFIIFITCKHTANIVSVLSHVQFPNFYYLLVNPVVCRSGSFQRNFYGFIQRKVQHYVS